MRLHSVVLAIISLTLAVTTSAEPLRGLVAANPRERSTSGRISERDNKVGVAFGRPPTGDLYKKDQHQHVQGGARRRGTEGTGTGAGGGMKRGPAGGEAAREPDGAANYLITLERSATNDVKDKILDILLRSGAVVKQTYDYRVFKGILFTVPQSDDKGLTSWQSSLGKQEGVKYVEEDSIVKIQ
ncbi:hypothetical protein JCM3765_005614 [Sporobolomyces pararoseus]